MIAFPDEAAGCPLTGIVASYTPRLAALAAEPGFVAAVDQHAAEIRERLFAQGPELMPRPLRRAELTDYALGFLDALAEVGWDQPVGYDYAVDRLTAICWLVHQNGLLDA
ncbi:DUF6401 family natural product biosynthesis protein [Kitasatospora indigofera]|uniref:Uncharacterized protein n=1 Tax=Kitasatospora indigofera TaxID=67307 RepID=A0A919FP76_9ACTN|nr:DUF6401 family natural product biosynthesis protein [Kitasatospora indigofera]GHH69464.1 hypothetical protein GCM10018781_28010 [Kitasatospora indigofera]